VKNNLVVTALSILVGFQPVLADTPTIEGGDHTLTANTANQSINITVSGGDNFAGLEPRIQIGDGATGPTINPAFVDDDNKKRVDTQSGIMNGWTLDSVLISDTDRHVTGSVGSIPPSNVAASGLLLVLEIDTTGITSGRFGILFEGTSIGDTQLLDTLSNVLPANFNSGTIAVGANPLVIWNGDDNANNTNFTNDLNWLHHAAPLAGDTIQFGGTIGTAVNMDQTANTAYHSITFNSDAQGFVLDGNAVGILDGGSITNNSALTFSYDDGSGPDTVGQVILVDIKPSGDLTLDAAAGDISLYGNISLTGTSTLTIDGAAGKTVDMLGNITGSTAIVDVDTLGNFILAGTNTFGTLNLNSGTTEIEDGTALLDTATVNIANGANMQLLNNETTGVIDAEVGSTINLQTNLLFLTGTGITLDGTITDNVGAGDHDFGAAGGLGLNTDGTVSISGANDYSLGTILGNNNTGGTSVMGNTITSPDVTISNNAAFGDGGLVLNSGSLTASGNLTLGNFVNIGGDYTFGAGGDLIFTNDVGIDGSLADGDDVIGMNLAAASRTLTVNNDTTFAGSINGTKNIIKNGTGTLLFSGDNNSGDGIFTGEVQIDAGTVKVTNDMSAADGFTINAGTLTVDDSALLHSEAFVDLDSSSAVFNVDTNISVPEMSGVAGSSVVVSTGNSLTLGAAAQDTIDDNLEFTTFNGVMSGGGNLIIAAEAGDPPGIVTFTGNNTFTGNTTINSGAFVVGGTHASAVTVNNTGIFGGDGTVNNDVTINSGGELTAVDSSDPTDDGIQTFNVVGDVNIASGGILFAIIDVTGGTATSDLINVTGGMTLSNGAVLDIAEKAGSVMEAGKEFTIASASSGITNNGASINEDISGFSFEASIVNNDLILTSMLQTEATWLVGDGNFSVESNWDNDPDGVQSDADDLVLVFKGDNTAGSHTVNADEAPYSSIGGIRFDNTTDTFTITGGLLTFNNTLSASIVNNTAQTQTIENNIATSAIVDLEIDADAGDLILSGDIANNNQLTVIGDNDTTLSGVISGTGALSKSEDGTLTITGTNTYTGNTTLSGGTILVGNDLAFGSTGTLNLAGGTLQSDNDTRTIANDLSISGDFATSGNILTLSGANATLNGGSHDITVSNTQTFINGTWTNGSLTKKGAGDLVVAGTLDLTTLEIAENTVSFTGPNPTTATTALNLSGATAQLNFDQTALTTVQVASLTGVAGSSINLGDDGSTLSIEGSDTTTFSGTITNVDGQLRYAGSGQQTLAGANTYTGDTIVDASATGTLSITGSVAGDVILMDGVGASDPTLELGDDPMATGTTLTIQGSNLAAATNAATLGSDVNIVVENDFAFAGTNSMTIAGPVDLNAENQVLTVNEGATVLTLSGIVSNGGLAKSGAGQINLIGTNTFANGFTLNAGTVGIGNDAALGSGTFVINGGTVTALGNGAITNAVVVANDFAVTGDSTASFGSSVDLSGASRTVTVTGAGVTTFQDITNGDLVKTGAGEVTLAGTNDLTTGLTVNAGTVNLGSAAALNAGDNLTINDGTVNIMSGLTVADLSGTGGILNLGGGTLTFGDDTDATLASTITGSNAIQKTGSGTQVFSGTNTYTGGTVLTNGNLAITNNSALGTGNIFANGGTLQANSSGLSLTNNVDTTAADFAVTGTTGNDLTLSGIISGANGVTKTGANTVTLSGANTYAGTTTISAGTLGLSGGSAIADTGAVNITDASATLLLNDSETIGSLTGTAGSVNLQSNDLTFGDANDTTFAGNITGTGGITKQGLGNVTLSGTNDFTGGVNFTSGTLTLEGGSALSDSVLLIQSSGSQLTLGADEAIGALSGDGTVELGANTLELAGTASTAYTGVIQGTGGLNYNNSGNMELGGANTFSGNFTVNNGRINLSGSVLNSDTVNINDGGSLLANNSGGNALADTAVVNVASDGRFENDEVETIKSLNVVSGGNVALGNDLTLDDSASTIAGDISGSGNLNIIGESTVALSGTNASTGTTTISGDGASNQSMLTLSGTSTAGALVVNGFGNVDLTGSAGDVTVNNNGSLLTTAGATDTATITGDFVLNAGGSLNVDISNNAGALTNDVYNVAGNATLADNSIIAINDLGPSAIAIDDSFEFLTFDGTLTSTLANVRLQESLSDVAFSLTSDGSALTLNTIAVTNITWDGEGNDGLFSTTNNWDDDVNGVTFDNTTDATAWDLDGKGIVFSGNTNNGGNVNADNGGNGATTRYKRVASLEFLDTNEVFTVDGLSLNFIDGQTTDITNNATQHHVINNSVVTGDGTMTVNANTGDLTFGGGITNNGGIIFTGDNDTTIGDAISGAGAVIKNGNGMLDLTVASTYSGGTTLASGTIRLGDDAALGTGVLTINGGTLNANGDRTIANDIELNNDVTIAGSNFDFSGAVTNTGTNILTIDNTQTEFSGNITGGGIGKEGSGLLILSGSNTLTSLGVSEGTVRLDNTAAVAGDTAVTISGTSLLDNNAGGDLTIDSLAGDAGATFDTGGFKVTIDGASTTTFAGTITNVGLGEVEHTGTGQLTLSGDNTYNGPTTITAGTVAITGSVDGNVEVNGGTFIIGADDAIEDGDSLIINSGNLQSNNDARNLSSGVDVTVKGDFAITGTNDLQLSGDVDLTAGSRTITTTDAANTTTLSGVISNGGITKDGAGELLLSGTNTFADSTTLTAGTLTLGNDAALGSGGLTINGGALASDDDARSIANTIAINEDFTLGGTNDLAITGTVSLAGGDAEHTLTVNNDTSITNNITAGDMTLAGTGMLSISGDNDFTTGVTVTNGTLSVDSSTAFDAGDNLTINGGLVDINSSTVVADLSGTSGTLNVDAAMAFGDDTDTTLGSVLTGASQIQKLGSGTQTLTGNSSTFTGGIVVNQGTVAVGHANALGSSATTLNGGTLASALDDVSLANNVVLTADSTINADTDLDMVLTGIVSGGFAVDKTGAGDLELQGQNTFNTLNITEGNVYLNHGSDALSDTAAVNITGSSSALVLFHNETIGSLAGTFGTVNLQSNTLTTGDATDTDFAGAIIGTGGLFKQGAGTMTLSGTNTFTGPVTVDAGILAVSGGSAIGDSTAVVVNSTFQLVDDETIGNLTGAGNTLLSNADLTLGTDTDFTYDGTFDGVGDVNYNGSGAMSLTNQSTVNGTLNVNNGVVYLKNTTQSWAGDVNVLAATLYGAGTSAIGGDLALSDASSVWHVGNNGSNNTGNFGVDGNVSLATGSTSVFRVDYDNTAGAAANTTFNPAANDYADIIGNLDVAPGAIINYTVQDDGDNATEGDAFSFFVVTGDLNLDSVTTTASADDTTFTVNGPALIDEHVEITYDGTYTYVRVVFDNLLNFEEATINSVNPGIGRALILVAAAADNNDPRAQAFITALENLDEAQLLEYVQQLNDGVDVTNLASRNVMQIIQTFSNVLSDHLSARRTNTPALANMHAGTDLSLLAGLTDDPHELAQVIANERDQKPQTRQAIPMNEWATFGKIYGIFSEQDAESGRSGYSSDGMGIQLGLDYQVNENLILGLSLDYANTEVTFDGGLGDIETDSFRVGPFATYFTENWFVNTSLTFGIHSSDGTRNDTATGVHESDYNASDVTFYLGGGYQYRLDENWMLTPTASMRYTYYNRDGYTETGTGGVTYGDYDLSTLYSRLGARLSYQLYTMDMIFIPEVMVGWEHEFLGDAGSGTTDLPGSSAFSVNTGNPDENSIFFGTGLTAIIDERWSTFLHYEGNVSSDGETHAISGGLRFDF
tara:strand:+ start:25828 stop:37062 length:11235 start_codon:yes stop_codon:yes gene_type:complete